ncbi:MAG: hypothetical protein BZY88_00765 [SAR202 cluster bacterium Io17-Chloro-G9]|nr:MAG: hypothetical protein BZY88_00765 [SAR202 cluster bacterium Io17-Chloro-G9]
MQFRFGRTGGGAFLGCGTFLALLGLVLLSDVGVWLIKGIGWFAIVTGVIFVLSGVYYWLTGPRRPRF